MFTKEPMVFSAAGISSIYYTEQNRWTYPVGYIRCVSYSGLNVCPRSHRYYYHITRGELGSAAVLVSNSTMVNR